MHRAVASTRAGCAVLACVLLVFTWLGSVAAYPGRFQATSCTDHPTTAMGKHLAPTLDANITFTVLTSNNTATAQLCLGETYAVQVSFPQNRLALLTSSVGQFANSTVTPLCPNRRIFTPSASVQSTSLTLTCDLSGASAPKEVTLQVTSATGMTSAFLQARTTLPVNAACGPCATLLAGASPAPSSTIASPSAGTSPSPSPAAVSGMTTPQCGSSSLGYACALPLAGGGGETLHWTAGTAAPPDNACTRLNASAAASASSSPADLIHFALSSPQSGFLAVGFTQRPGMMTPSNVVLGRIVSGVAQVNTFRPTSYSLGTPTTATGWAAGATVLSTSAGGRVLCFSVAANGAAAAATTAPSRRRLAAATTTSAAHRRSLSDASASAVATTAAATPNNVLGLSAAGLEIIWASSNAPDAMHNRKGGVSLNVLSGAAAATAASDRRNQMLALHGALAAAGWVLLVPLGLLLARHRRNIALLRSAPKLGGKDMWFVLHLSCVVTGVCCGAASIGVAVQELRGSGMSDSTATAHRAIGWTVLGLAVLQLMVGGVKPQPDAPRRQAWFRIHSNIGRVTTMLAWAGTGIGVYMATTRYGQDMTAWVAPLVATLGLMLGAELGLELSATAADGRAGEAYIVKELPTKGELGLQAGSSPSGKWMGGVSRKSSSGGGGLTHQSSGVTSQSSTGFEDKEATTGIDCTAAVSARG